MKTNPGKRFQLAFAVSFPYGTAFPGLEISERTTAMDGQIRGFRKNNTNGWTYLKRQKGHFKLLVKLMDKVGASERRLQSMDSTQISGGATAINGHRKCFRKHYCNSWIAPTFPEGQLQTMSRITPHDEVQGIILGSDHISLGSGGRFLATTFIWQSDGRILSSYPWAPATVTRYYTVVP